MIKIAIDPGSSSGSLVIKTGDEYLLYPFNKSDFYVIDNALKLAKESDSVRCIIEKVHTMPGQGISSAGKFMENYGIMKGLLIANRIPFKEVPPQTWMKVLPINKKYSNETKTQWKNRLMQHAKQLVPDLKIVHTTADAILMIEYFDQIYNK